ncbi:MAG: STAS domain-containing protein [Bauldia sp.]
MSTEPLFDISSEGNRLRLVASGAWTTDHADPPPAARRRGGPSRRGTPTAEIDVAGIEKIDTFGAWLLERTVRRLEAAGGTARLTEVPDRYRGHVRRGTRHQPEAGGKAAGADRRRRPH